MSLTCVFTPNRNSATNDSDLREQKQKILVFIDDIDRFDSRDGFQVVTHGLFPQFRPRAPALKALKAR